MANRKLNKKPATSINTRIDVIAKTIINRSSKSYRQILENTAYSSISKENTQLIVISSEELKELKEDIIFIKANLAENNKDIAYLESKLERAKQLNNSLTKKLNTKQNKLNKINDSIQYLEDLKENYSEEITYGIANATKHIEKVLVHNYELRLNGPRARVKESEIKQICNKYKVTIQDVLNGIDPKYLECMDGFDKYL